MDEVYWLVFIAVAASAGIWINHWYKKPTNLEPATIISFAHQTLEIMVLHLHEKYVPVSRERVIDPYLKKRDIKQRQRRDVISYMIRSNWIYERSESNYRHYVLLSDGWKEFWSAESVRQAAKGEYQNILVDARGATGVVISNIGNHGFSRSRDIRLNSGHRELAARLADALRVDARSSDRTEECKQAAVLAGEIDQAVVKKDTEKLDKLIGRVRDLLQIATYAFPLAHDVIQLILK